MKDLSYCLRIETKQGILGKRQK